MVVNFQPEINRISCFSDTYVLKVVIPTGFKPVTF